MEEEDTVKCNDSIKVVNLTLFTPKPLEINFIYMRGVCFVLVLCGCFFFFFGDRCSIEKSEFVNKHSRCFCGDK